MGIQIEFNPDLALRAFGTSDRKKEECLPEKLEVGEVYSFLLNGEGEGITLKIKSKLPKPGKSEDKVDDKFCQLELDGKYYHAAKEDFFWDLPECKKAGIEHRYIITEIVLPKTNEKDYAKIREMARRKGKIIRIINADGKEIKSENHCENRNSSSTS